MGRKWPFACIAAAIADDDELRSELQWITALAERGFANPVPKKSNRGNLLETVAGIQVDMISWLDGTPLGTTGAVLELDDRSGAFRRIGSALARMHTLSDDWHAPAEFTPLSLGCRRPVGR